MQAKTRKIAIEMRRILIILLLCCAIFPLAAQYHTRIIDPNIHTLRTRYLDDGGVLQRPILVLENGMIDGSEPHNTLEISFDELSHDLRMYSYTIKHLDYNWTPSALSSYEYLRGYTTADIDDYALSLNTQQVYTNYRFTFPNEDMQLLVSGNYVLLIYEDGDPDNVVAQVCFSVVEPLVGLDAVVRGNTDKEFNGRYQQLDLDVNTSNLDVRNPQELKIVVRQNNRLDNEIVVDKPTFVEPNRLRYTNQSALIFEGGNEFRHFDTYSTYYAGYHVDRIRYGQGEYHAFLDVDEVRGTMGKGAGREGVPYLTENDANGQWVVNCEKSDDVDTEAEYMWVHFVLPVKEPVMDGVVFVAGDVFDNQYGIRNRMEYDADQKCYYLYAYLKQGGYDYMYHVVRRNGVTTLPLEGSHWQTQNEYSVRVYYRPFGGRYDQLVGYKVL